MEAGPELPASGTNDNAIGTVAWTNPENVTASDDAYATNTGSSGSISNYLKATDFGFAIPTDATIDGIAVVIARKSSQNGALRYTYDNIVKLVVGGSVVGDNKAATTTKWPLTEADATYGGASDKWGLSPTASQINASNFGVVLAVENNGAAGATASVDHISVTVAYTESGGGTARKQSRTLSGVGW